MQIFDRALCVRQLRYAGLMETAKIRQAGYPIRYSYAEFVHRYRLIVPNIPPAEKADCKDASKRICAEVLKGEDYKLGHTKVFLKDAHDAVLEELRHKVLIRAVIKVQANGRRFLLRQKFLRMKAAALTIQKHFRARGFRKRYLIMKRGYSRMQAAIKSRQLRKSFVGIRRFMTNLQARSRGHLIRKLIKEKGHIIKSTLIKFAEEKEAYIKELQKSGKTDAQKRAEDDYEAKVSQLMKTIWIAKEMPAENNMQGTIIDDNYVDDVFGFLKDSGGTVRGPSGGVRELK